MTHEEFLGIKPEDGITLTDEDRKAVEDTVSWKMMKVGEAMRKFAEAWDKSWRKTFGLKEGGK